MELKAKIAISMAILLLYGCSAEPNIEVSIHPDHYGDSVVTIQAIANDVVVKKVFVNRGICDESQLNRKLAFAEKFISVSPCKPANVKEIEVTTNAGTFVFSFN